MDPNSLTSGTVFVESNTTTDELFCQTLHIDHPTWTQGPTLDLRVPETLRTKGMLTADRIELAQGVTVTPAFPTFGDEPLQSYVHFVHPGPGFGTNVVVRPRVAMEGALGAREGAIELRHDEVEVKRFDPEDVDPENSDIVVRGLDVDALGHIRRIERVDLRRLYEGNQDMLEDLFPTFVRNSYPLYNDVRLSGGTELFLNWYQNVTGDASGESQSIDLGRFTSIAVENLTGVSTDHLFRGIVATRSGYVVMVPFESDFVLAWNTRTGIEKRVFVNNERYAGGCLLPDDRVLLAPFDQGSRVKVYDPVTNTLSNDGPNLTGFWGAIVHPSGHVVLAAGPNDDTIILDVHTLDLKHKIPVDEAKPTPFESWFAGMVMDARGRIWMVPYDHSTADVLVWEVGAPTPTKVQGPEIRMNQTYKNNTSPTPVDQKRCINGSLAYDGTIVMGSHNVLPTARFVHVDATVDDGEVAQATVTRIPDTDDPGTTQTILNVTHGTFVLPDGRIGVVPHNSSSIQVIDPTKNEQNEFVTIQLDSINPGTRFSGACLLEDGRVVFCPSGVDFSETNDNRLGFYIQPVRPPRDMVYHPFWNHA